MLEEHAQMDVLTNLWNHAHFLSRLEEEVISLRRYKRHFSVMRIKIIDLFSECQERGLQKHGDEAFIAIGNMLTHACRICDVPCRVGLNEFDIILPETRAHGLMPFATRLINDIEHVLVELPTLNDITKLLCIKTIGVATDQFEPINTVTSKNIIERLALVETQQHNLGTLISKHLGDIH